MRPERHLTRAGGGDSRPEAHAPTRTAMAPTRQVLAPGEPHYPDHWAGRRFTPRLIAPTATAAWVIESGLPLLARIDTATGEVTGPLPLERPESAHPPEAAALVATDDAVWVRWSEGVTRFDPSSGEQRSLALGGGRLLAAGEEGVWTLGPDGLVARIDHQATRVELAGASETRVHNLAVGAGAVWTLSSADAPGRCTLSRLDPSTGALDGTLTLEGNPGWSPRALMVESGSVWVSVWRKGTAGRSRKFLVGVPASAMSITSEIEIDSTGAVGPVLDGELWVLGEQPSSPERGMPTTLHRLDATSGAPIGEVPVSGWIDSLVAGPASVWGCLERHEQWPCPVIEIDPSGTERVLSLDHLDVSAQLPPPPRPIRARPVEEEIRDSLARVLFGGWIGTDPDSGEKIQRPYIRGVSVEEVRLEGKFPDTLVVALFRAHDRPGMLFGRRQRVWEDDGTYSGVIDVLDVNLMEHVETLRNGLPADRQPDDTGVVWVEPVVRRGQPALPEALSDVSAHST